MTAEHSQKSTIVRLNQWFLGLGFGVGERVAPALGARFAEGLWFRLPVRSRDDAPATGTPFEVLADGCAVRGWTWGAGPVVYLAHGWGGHAAQLGSFVDPLVAQGFTVVAFDAPSHGQSAPGPSGPRESHAVEFGKALDAVAAVHGPAQAVIAHSMGAMSTMLTLKHGWLSTERLVLLAPMSDLDSYLSAFAAVAGFGRRTRAALDRRMQRRVGMAVAEFDLGRLAREVDPPGLLVVHDRRDRQTSYAASERLVRRWPGARMVSTDDLGHRRILRDADVVQLVTRFVADGARSAAA